MIYVVQVTGDRNWTDRTRIAAALFDIEVELDSFVERVLRHGCANGADKLFGACALQLGWYVQEFPAQWDKYGRAAGPIRNREMIEAKPKADICLAAHDDIADSKGTANMVKQCEGAHIPVRWVPPAQPSDAEVRGGAGTDPPSWFRG